MFRIMSPGLFQCFINVLTRVVGSDLMSCFLLRHPDLIRFFGRCWVTNDTLDDRINFFDSFLKQYEMQTITSCLSQRAHDFLLTARNADWMFELTEMLKKPSFIAVGLAHLLASDNLIELLEYAGFEVTSMECPRKTLDAELRFDEVMRELKHKVPLTPFFRSAYIDRQDALFAAQVKESDKDFGQKRKRSHNTPEKHGEGRLPKRARRTPPRFLSI